MSNTSRRHSASASSLSGTRAGWRPSALTRLMLAHATSRLRVWVDLNTVVVTEMRDAPGRWKLAPMWISTYSGVRRLAGLLGLVCPLLFLAAPAGATGPTYPGET